jgi:hypothetical protein
MQRQGCADADHREHRQHSQTPKQYRPTTARLVLTVSDRKLMAKEINAFVVANLIKAQLQRDRLSEKLQLLFLQPREKSAASQ